MTNDASSKNWELTLYELNRKPQEPITDGTVIAVSPRSLKSELMCPICLDILKITMTTKECLHRFCSECIITALRSGNKECPTCRKKLVSKRSLRRDPNFDSLISKIYPSRQEYEAHQDKILARLNRQHLSTSLTRSLEQQLGLGCNRIRNFINGRSTLTSNGAFCSTDPNLDNAVSDEETPSNFGICGNDLASRRTSDTESVIDTNSIGDGSSISDMPSRNSTGTNQTSLMSNMAISHSIQGNVIHSNSSTSPSVFPEIEVLLKPHPKYNQQSSSPSTSGSTKNILSSQSNGHQSCNDQSGGPTKYLKAPTITTVHHLCRYLTVRINLQKMNREVTDENVNFTLYTYNEQGNVYCALDSHTSIEEISRNSFNGSNCIDLYYARDDMEDF